MFVMLETLLTHHLENDADEEKIKLANKIRAIRTNGSCSILYSKIP